MIIEMISLLQYWNNQIRFKFIVVAFRIIDFFLLLQYNFSSNISDIIISYIPQKKRLYKIFLKVFH